MDFENLKKEAILKFIEEAESKIDGNISLVDKDTDFVDFQLPPIDFFAGLEKLQTFKNRIKKEIGEELDLSYDCEEIHFFLRLYRKVETLEELVDSVLGSELVSEIYVICIPTNPVKIYDYPFPILLFKEINNGTTHMICHIDDVPEVYGMLRMFGELNEEHEKLKAYLRELYHRERELDIQKMNLFGEKSN